MFPTWYSYGIVLATILFYISSQSCTENIKNLTSSVPVTSLCCAVCDLLTSATNLFDKPTGTASNLPSNLTTEWQEFFSEAAFTVLLPLLVELLGKYNLLVARIRLIFISKENALKEDHTSWTRTNTNNGTGET